VQTKRQEQQHTFARLEVFALTEALDGEPHGNEGRAHDRDDGDHGKHDWAQVVVRRLVDGASSANVAVPAEKTICIIGSS